MEGGESEDLATKMDICLTGMEIGIPEEAVVPVEREEGIAFTDPGDTPQNLMTERRPIVRGKNYGYIW